MRLVHNMVVKGNSVPIGVQCLILNSHFKRINKFEIVSYVVDWLNLPQSEALRVVESVIGVCCNENA